MRISFALLFVFCSSMQSQRQHQESLVLFPDNLKPPSNETPTLRAHAEGDQIYVCDGSSWMLSRPDAKLFADSGKQIGSHFAGPTWEYSDGSRVMAKPVASVTQNPDSIPWLLLKATDHQGEGVMKGVTSLQRLSTKGGRAPATGCDAQHKGQEARSHYSALYIFYTGS